MKGYGLENMALCLNNTMSYKEIRNKKLPVTVTIRGNKWEVSSSESIQGENYKTLKEYLEGKKDVKIEDFTAYAFLGVKNTPKKAVLESEEGSRKLIPVSNEDIDLLKKTGLVVFQDGAYYALNERAKDALGRLINCSYVFRNYGAQDTLRIFAQEIATRNLIFWIGRKTTSNIYEVVNVTASRKPEGLMNMVKKRIKELEEGMNGLVKVTDWNYLPEEGFLSIIFSLDIYNNTFVKNKKIYVEFSDEKPTMMVGVCEHMVVGYYSCGTKINSLNKDIKAFDEKYESFKARIIRENEIDLILKDLEKIIGKARMESIRLEKGEYKGKDLLKKLTKDFTDMSPERKLMYLKYLSEITIK